MQNDHSNHIHFAGKPKNILSCTYLKVFFTDSDFDLCTFVLPLSVFIERAVQGASRKILIPIHPLKNSKQAVMN